MTGFPSVDVKSVGAGGGSIAWVDAGGLLHVGPQSAGADARAGLLRPRRHAADGHRRLRWCSATSIPSYFLGGRMRLDVDAARAAIDGARRRAARLERRGGRRGDR